MTDILINLNLRHDPGQREKRTGYGSGKQVHNYLYILEKHQKRESVLNIGAAGHIIKEEVNGLRDLNRWVAVKGRLWKR